MSERLHPPLNLGPIPISSSVSNKLANLSFVCSLLVVLSHFPHAESGTVGFFYQVFPGSLRYMAVPFFFAVSGYLLAGGFEKSDWWLSALKKRVHSLLIPYVILNLLFGGWELIHHNVLGPKIGIEPYAVNGRILLEFLGLLPQGNGPAIAPLWYVRTLLMLVVLSPLLKRVVDWNRVAAWLLVVVLAVISVPLAERYGFFFKFFLPLFGVAYFLAGMLLRNLHLSVGNWRWGLVTVVAGVVLNYFFSWSAYGRAIVNPLLVFGLWSVVPAGNWWKGLTANAFPIYVFHAVAIHFLLIGVRRVGLSQPMNSNLLLNMAGCLMVVLISMGVALCLRRFSFTACYFLGGR